MRLGHGEDHTGGRQKSVLLCATFEAMIGALFLESDIPTIQRLIHPMLEKFNDQIIFSSDSRDPKSRLQEWSQMRMGIPKYASLTVSGPDHQRMFEIEVLINGISYGRGVGHNKQAADARQPWLPWIGLKNPRLFLFNNQMPLRLRSLELHGYKTFAAKTRFEFAEGITAIVGPNGSGKSNIADALRWVLGEQIFSLYHAKKTEDMIFTGSEQRSRAGWPRPGSCSITPQVGFRWISLMSAYHDGLTGMAEMNIC